MSTQIPERDWRQFKLVHAELLERFCARVLEEIAVAVTSTDGTAHERYLRVSKLIEERDGELANAFDDFRRSTAEIQLIIMRRMGLLTDADLESFSEQTRKRIRSFDAIPRSEPDDAPEGG
ncbi:MAG: hypothetical protein AMXMBFR82_18800 [Candidatus Hydrogenedentota bacterium]